MESGKLAIVRGGGDLATGIIYRLWKVGCSVLSLEIPAPLVVRRTVAAASAVFDGETVIEDMKAVRIDSLNDFSCDRSRIYVLVDPEGRSISELRPDILVDAIMAKENLGTHKGMAPVVIGIGPGFSAPDDVDAVIETKRGHYLGRVIRNGSAIPNTGVPGLIRGYTVERLLRSPGEGYVIPVKKIGDSVMPGDVVAHVGGLPVSSQIEGIVRGLIHPSVKVKKGLKIGDIDPRGEREHCFSITDKSLAIAGGVLEVIMSA
ncbi:MAG: selenium-dependent molybdenum cofactor biosynthesis protein YqeB [Synergistaceae bacterium]|jgi:xanthine dehydrogenase accessory factor|nr:selenium-dependent molybdenum cofactor biosynthesis protein YqeB [Synergistaceae bacterium]